MSRQTVAVTPASSLERLLPWVLRLTWVGVGVAGWEALDGATQGRHDAMRTAVLATGAICWVVGVAAIVVPAVISLTAARVIVPLSVPTAATAWIAGASATDSALFLALAVVSMVVSLSADVGRTFVQASAYGDEDRHLLRAPAAYALAAALAWVVWAAALIAGLLLLASRSWLFGAPLGVVAIVGAILLWPRWHRLSRRWLVFVPVGVVVHDQLVLAETLMLRRTEIARIRLAPADTQAADLTGLAAGHTLEITTNESVTVIRAATPSTPQGTAIHMTACLVSPTRPGAALAAAGARHLRVG